MAKQTFTTGSVLTATQMNDLQTNDFNQTVSQKTASYVLVAADKGTRIEMNAAGATTVTVNTGLFSAGDTLFIQNIGAGACTVTAGTATVDKSTAGSLTLSQYQGGTLYFISPSSAVFFADAGYTPPLTTKGDLFGYSTSAARIPIGSNDQVLTADSTQALGLKWATPASGSMTLLSTTSLSGASTTVSSISTAYKDLLVEIYDYYTSAEASFQVTINSGTNYPKLMMNAGSNSTTYESQPTLGGNYVLNATNRNAMSVYYFPRYSDTTIYKMIQFWDIQGSGAAPYTQWARLGVGAYQSDSAITSVTVACNAGTFSAGTIKVYGVN